MIIRLSSDLQYDSIVDGKGLRTIIWTQGCPHHCLGCHNPHTHDFNKGKLVDVEDIKKQLSEISNQDGITLSGGEPLYQPEACAEIAKYAHTVNLNVWCYTGYTYEEIFNMSKDNPHYMDLLKNIDVLVDGKFMLEQRSFNLKYRGSRNQRVIDVQRSLKEQRVVLFDEYNIEEDHCNLYKKPECMFV